MGAGYSTYLQAECLNTPLNNNIDLFKTITSHVVFSSPDCSNQRESGFFGCQSSPLLSPPVPYTENIPENYIPVSETVVYGKLYGKTGNTNPVLLTALNGDPVYFNSTEFAPWTNVKYCPAPYNVYNRSGPAFENCHCYGSLQRKLNNNNTYQDRLYYDFIDSGVQVPHPDYTFKQCGTGCPTNNWLIFSQPATNFWTSIPEPFKITTHFEQSGSACPSSPSYGGNLYIPFCDNMPVRKSDGTLAGYYTGLAFSLVYGQCSVVFPVRPYLPPDPYSPVPPPNTPEVDPKKAMWSVEMSTYFRGTSVDPGYEIGSPLLSKIRFWLYSLAPGGPGQTRDWRFPFRILYQSSVYADYPTIIDCNVIGSGPYRITLNQTNVKVLITY